MKKILVHQLRDEEIKLIEKLARETYHTSVVQVDDFSKLLDSDVGQYSSFFIKVDEDTETDNLEAVLKYFARIPCHIVLEENNYDALKLGFRYRVNEIFENKIQISTLERAMLRVSVIADEDGKLLPVEQIVRLFSNSMKIKTNLDLYNRLANYFKSFQFDLQFSLLERLKDGSQMCYGEAFDDKIFKAALSTRLQRRYVGQVVEIEPGVFATPVFDGKDQKVWVLLKIESEKQDFVFNSLFFKFLEGVMHFRATEEKQQTLEMLAKTDEVTGLYNQRKLSEDLEAAVKLHEQEHDNFSLMFIDVDHFKNVNDSHGHLIGSKLLLDMGTVLVNILRQSDHVYRYGGDEFVVIMPHVKLATVYDIANRVLNQIKKTNFEIDGGEIYKLSVSIGIAEYPTDAKSALEIIKFADEMMYMSKKSGRGKVFHINEVEDAGTGS